MENVTVVGVDHERHAAYSRRYAADGAGFGHVRVHHVGLDLANQSDHARE